MPGGHRVHILGGRHDGLMARPARTRNGSGSTPRTGLVPAGMHAAQFSKTAVRLLAAGLAAATPKTGKKRASRQRGRTNPNCGSVWLLGSRTLLSRSVSSATEEYSAARHEHQRPGLSQGPDRSPRRGTTLSARPAAACGAACRPAPQRRRGRRPADRAGPHPQPARRYARLPARSGAVPRCG